MYSIGKFSSITGVSTKTLIWYDSIGLLKPDYVNEENGYRYYTADSIKRLANIHFLQSLDFSIDEIINLTSEVVQNKISHLRKKIDYIENNIPFLERLGGVMKEKILTMYDVQKSKEHQARIQGKWAYAFSTNSFAEAIKPCSPLTKPTQMPKELFLGEEQSGTDGKNLIYFSIDKIYIKEKCYTFLIMNLDESLILFERQDPFDEKINEKLYFHVYRRLGNTPYTKSDFEKIMAKEEYRHIKVYDFEDYDGRFEGLWQHIDNVQESEIKGYKERKNKDTFNILYPMFDKLTFSGNEVAVMSEDDTFTITGNGKETTYIYENSKMTLGNCKNEAFIANPILNVRHKIVEKEVDGEKLLFINFTGELDSDENTTIYVYKKISEVQNAKN